MLGDSQNFVDMINCMCTKCTVKYTCTCTVHVHVRDQIWKMETETNAHTVHEHKKYRGTEVGSWLPDKQIPYTHVARKLGRH